MIESTRIGRPSEKREPPPPAASNIEAVRRAERIADMPSDKWIRFGDARQLAIWLGGEAGLYDLNRALLPSLAPIPVRIVARDNQGAATPVSPHRLMHQIAPNGDWRTLNRRALANAYLEVDEAALSQHIATTLGRRLKSSHSRAPMLSQGQWSLLEGLAWLATHDDELVNFLRPFAHSPDPKVRTNAFRALCWTVAKRDNIGLRFLWQGLPGITEAFGSLSSGLTGGSIKATEFIRGIWRESRPSKFSGMQMSIQAPGFWPGIHTLILIDRSKIIAHSGFIGTKQGSASQTVRKPGRGRPKGSGSYAEADAPLLAEMRQLIAGQEAFSPDGAAKMIAHKAKGGGTLDSRANRLARRYSQSENN